MQEAQDERTPEFLDGLAEDGFAELFLGSLGSRLGSTTHISVIDGAGRACAVTCTNGEGSGIVVPGTGIHVNNIMGEEDLSPLGFHHAPAGRRMPSMMSPTIVMAGGEVQIALGSSGSNRIRSALLQTIVAVVDHGLPAAAALAEPRVHYEDGLIYAEPGIPLDELGDESARGQGLPRDEHVLRRRAGRHARPRVRRAQRRRRPAPRRRGGCSVSRGPRHALACAALLAAGAGVVACGTPSPDLFVVKRDGSVPGAKLQLLVSDQTARCNGGPAKDLTSEQILEARDILRELLLVQAGDDPIPAAARAQIFSFAVQTEQGTLRYPDTQQRPEILPRLSRFVRRVAIDTCGLER